MPPGFSRRGAGGASPRQNKVKSLPLPRRGRGLGGWGQKDKLKAGSDGNHPPAAPLRGQRRQSQPATPGTSPLGALLSKGKARAARVQARGCKGRSPLHEITLVSPFPPGRGTGGMGEKRQTNGMVGRRGERQAPQRHLFSQPRGRGPSQTPKFLSPGPPSPWLPALLVGNCFLPFSRRTVGSAAGVPGASAPGEIK